MRATAILFSALALAIAPCRAASSALDLLTSNASSDALLVTELAVENVDLSALTQFPALPKLQTLRLTNTTLTAMPQGVADLTALQSLNVSINAIERVDLSAIPSTLQFLDLSRNALTQDAITVNATALRNLTHLYLHSNRLAVVPTWIFSMSSLRVLTLQNNSALQHIQLDAAQIAFLSQLTGFSIDAAALDTSCASPVSIANTALVVCRSGDAAAAIETTQSHNSSNRKTVIILTTLGVTLGVVVLVTLFVIRRRNLQQRSMFKAGDMHEDLLSSDDCTESAMETPRSHVTDASMSEYAPRSSVDFFRAALHRHSHMHRIRRDKDLQRVRIEASELSDLEVLSRTNSGAFQVSLALYKTDYVAVKRCKNLETAVITSNTSEGEDDDANADASSDAASSSNHATSTQMTRQQRSELLQRFVQDIKLHARLRHAKIVRFVGVAWTHEHATDLQAVYEFMVNRDLFTYISNLDLMGASAAHSTSGATHFWNEFSFKVALDIAEALVYLHSVDSRIRHGNLTSKCVMLDEALTAKLTGFAVADESLSIGKMEDDHACWWTPPEILAGRGKRSRAADIYALGVILSELDTRSVPFAEVEDAPRRESLARICAGDLQPTFQESSPPAVVALAKRCLALDPLRRPSAKEVLQALQTCYEETKSDVITIVTVQTSSSSTTTTSISSRTTQQQRQVVDTISSAVHSQGGFHSHCRRAMLEKEGSMTMHAHGHDHGHEHQHGHH